MLKFDSALDALNFMGKYGWELMSVVPASTSKILSNQYFDHQYVMKKRREVKVKVN